MPGSRLMTSRAPLLVAAPLLLALASGCNGEKSYDAEEFVAELNSNDPVIALGEPLTTSDADQELYAVEVIEAEGEAEHAADEEEGDEAEQAGDEAEGEGEAEHAADEDGGTDEHAHGSGGSLIVAPDEEEAFAEYERCETALSLLCYRAANVVLRIEELAPDDRRRMDHAFIALGAEE